jgi:Glycosyltransferase family 92
MHYLAACAIYLNEAPYLEEWIEFHRLVGVEKFFLYNHMSDDGHREVLRPYVEEGTLVVRDWPDEPGQVSAYHDCLDRHRDEARWIAFIDLDEFLFSPTLAPLPEVLKDYEPFPGVVVNWAMFGTSGHKKKPAGLVLENYLLRAEDDFYLNHMVKSIVDPSRTVRVRAGINPHCFDYTEGFAVDERLEPQQEKPFMRTAEVSFERLRVNHYRMKSEEQWFDKLKVPSPQTGEVRSLPPEDFVRMEEGSSKVRDDRITAYVPALKAALAARREGEPAASH